MINKRSSEVDNYDYMDTEPRVDMRAMYDGPDSAEVYDRGYDDAVNGRPNKEPDNVLYNDGYSAGAKSGNEERVDNVFGPSKSSHKSSYPRLGRKSKKRSTFRTAGPMDINKAWYVITFDNGKQLVECLDDDDVAAIEAGNSLSLVESCSGPYEDESEAYAALTNGSPNYDQKNFNMIEGKKTADLSWTTTFVGLGANEMIEHSYQSNHGWFIVSEHPSLGICFARLERPNGNITYSESFKTLEEAKMWCREYNDQLDRFDRDNQFMNNDPLSGFLGKKTAGVKYPHIVIDLMRIDGNAYSIMGAAQQAMRRGGVPAQEIEAYIAEATSGDYDHLVQTTMRWIDTFGTSTHDDDYEEDDYEDDDDYDPDDDDYGFYASKKTVLSKDEPIQKFVILKNKGTEKLEFEGKHYDFIQFAERNGHFMDLLVPGEKYTSFIDLHGPMIHGDVVRYEDQSTYDLFEDQSIYYDLFSASKKTASVPLMWEWYVNPQNGEGHYQATGENKWWSLWPTGQHKAWNAIVEDSRANSYEGLTTFQTLKEAFDWCQHVESDYGLMLEEAVRDGLLKRPNFTPLRFVPSSETQLRSSKKIARLDPKDMIPGQRYQLTFYHDTMNSRKLNPTYEYATFLGYLMNYEEPQAQFESIDNMTGRPYTWEAYYWDGDAEIPAGWYYGSSMEPIEFNSL